MDIFRKFLHQIHIWLQRGDANNLNEKFTVDSRMKLTQPTHTIT